MKRFADWTIRSKLFLVISLLVIIPLLSVAYLANKQFTGALKRAAEDDLEHIIDTLHALFETNLVQENNRYYISPERMEKITAVIQGLVIGDTGYAYVINSQGTLIIHPTKTGENILSWQDTRGDYFIQELVEKAVAAEGLATEKIRYPWINVELGETSPREKLVEFRYISQMDWIIAAGSYEEEIFRAAYQTRNTVFLLTVTSLVAAHILMFFLARYLTRPILELTQVTARMAEGELSLRAPVSQHDEIGQLAKSFNRMGSQIQQYTKNLEHEVARRTQELVDSKEKYKEISILLTNILESSTEYAIIATDLKRKIVEFNAGAQKTFGWSKEEAKGSHLSMTYASKADFALDPQELQEIHCGSALEREVQRKKRNGEIYLSRSVTTAIRDAEGEIIGYLEVSRDITARKRLERELLETKDYLENILESSVDGIITADQKGIITYINRGMEEILGSKKEEYIGTHVSLLYVDGIAEARKIMSILRRDQKMSNYEMILRSKLGREVSILTSAALLKNFQGENIGTVGVFKDISEKKKLEADLQKAEATLMHAAKMRELGDLVSGVAHEINNPLMASQTILFRIKENISHDPEHCNCPNSKLIDLIERCNNRIATIVNHLREFSRQTETKFEPLHVTAPISSALLITEQQLLDHEIQVVKDFADDLPMIKGSASQIEQVFLNIISNARDALDNHSSDKELIIRAFCRTKGNGLQEVVISFTDTGPGISPENLYKVFDPFFSTKEVGSGTGLGLSICYGIVEKHGGRIEVDSELGKGATFRVVLPTLSDNRYAKRKENNGDKDTGSG